MNKKQLVKLIEALKLSHERRRELGKALEAYAEDSYFTWDTALESYLMRLIDDVYGEYTHEIVYTFLSYNKYTVLDRDLVVPNSKWEKMMRGNEREQYTKEVITTAERLAAHILD